VPVLASLRFLSTAQLSCQVTQAKGLFNGVAVKRAAERKLPSQPEA